MLRAVCENCGHNFDVRTRNTTKKRQCRECYSTRIHIVDASPPPERPRPHPFRRTYELEPAPELQEPESDPEEQEGPESEPEPPEPESEPDGDVELPPEPVQKPIREKTFSERMLDDFMGIQMIKQVEKILSEVPPKPVQKPTKEKLFGDGELEWFIQMQNIADEQREIERATREHQQKMREIERDNQEVESKKTLTKIEELIHKIYDKKKDREKKEWVIMPSAIKPRNENPEVAIKRIDAPLPPPSHIEAIPTVPPETPPVVVPVVNPQDQEQKQHSGPVLTSPTSTKIYQSVGTIILPIPTDILQRWNELQKKWDGLKEQENLLSKEKENIESESKALHIFTVGYRKACERITEIDNELKNVRKGLSDIEPAAIAIHERYPAITG